MFLHELRIISGNNGMIRKVDFHKGVNIVVDTADSKNHNGAGKTTFLKLIDIAMGAKNKKYLYIDSDTNNTNVHLKNLINEHKIFIELDIVDRQKKITTLKVDLFDRGFKYINSKRKNEKDYYKALNKLLFDNNANYPTFRSLIGAFVRISTKKDKYEFLKYLDSRTKKTEYRGVYNFLYNISDSNLSKTLTDLNNEITSLSNSKKKYQSVRNINNTLEELKQLAEASHKEEIELENRLNDIIKGTDFLKNREKIFEYRQIYMDISSEISNLQYELQLINENIKNVDSYSKNKVTDDLAKEFFQEVSELIPNVQKDYNQLIKFNAALSQNSLNYFKSSASNLEHKISNLQENRRTFLEKNHNLIGLIKDNDIDKYDSLNSELLELKNHTARYEEQILALTNFDTKISELNDKLSNVKDEDLEKSKKYRKTINLFNSYFSPLAKELTNRNESELPVLIYNPDNSNFPISINNLGEGSSTGSRKSLILSYDIAYQKFAAELNKTVPNFIVHDILENIEGPIFSKIVNETKSLSSQLIFAVLQEKLDSSNISLDEQKKYTILTLSNEDRLFEPSNS